MSFSTLIIGSLFETSIVYGPIRIALLLSVPSSSDRSLKPRGFRYARSVSKHVSADTSPLPGFSEPRFSPLLHCSIHYSPPFSQIDFCPKEGGFANVFPHCYVTISAFTMPRICFLRRITAWKSFSSLDLRKRPAQSLFLREALPTKFSFHLS